MTELARLPRRTEAWGENHWQTLLHHTAQAYLAPGYDPANPVSAQSLAQEAGITVTPGEALIKTERYSLAAALSRIITDQLVSGSSDETRFQAGVLVADEEVIHGIPAREEPFNLMEKIMQKSVKRTSYAMLDDPATRVRHFTTRYDQKTMIAAAHGEPRLNSALILQGGTAAAELKFYARTVARAYQETPATRELDEAARIAGAHQMLPILTGRAAIHIKDTDDQRRWINVERAHPHIRPLTGTPEALAEAAQAHQEVGEPFALPPLTMEDENGPLFAVARKVSEHVSPLLRCPAHQRLGGMERALQRQLHAGINLAGERGLFDPTFAVPPPLPKVIWPSK